MKKEIAGLMGAVASLGAFNAAEAAPVTPTSTEILQASSFSDLLQPIPNAAALLQIVDEAGPARPDENIQTVQYFVHHHHHHHHHSQYRRYAPRVVIVRPRRHHHHHHHHHSFYRRDY